MSCSFVLWLTKAKGCGIIIVYQEKGEVDMESLVEMCRDKIKCPATLENISIVEKIVCSFAAHGELYAQQRRKEICRENK